MTRTKTRLGKPLLTRDRIARAALDYIDHNGLEALSTRKLARVLGCEAMTLYHHFPTKDALLDAVADRLVLSMKLPRRKPTTIAGFVRGARALYDVAARHPNAFPLLALRRASTPVSLRFYDQLVAPLLEMGLAPKDAALVFRMTGYFTLGAGLARIATHAHHAKPGALDELPSMQTLAPHLSREGVDALFARGCDLLARCFTGKLVGST